MSRLDLKSFSLLLIFFSFLLFTNCATLFVGPNDKIFLNSEPLGTKVYIDGNYMGVTPLHTKLEKTKSYHIEYRLADKEPIVYTLNRNISKGWLVFDVLTGFLPAVIDASTGSWYVFEEKDIYVTFNENDELFTWKMDLIEITREFWFQNQRSGQQIWRNYAKRHQIQMSPSAWISCLTESDYNDYINSGKSLNDWLKDKLNEK